MSLYNRYEIAFATYQRPFAYVDLNVIDRNITFVRDHVGSKQLRIATKSVRSVDMLHYIAKRVPTAGWMTFSLSEMKYLLEAGFNHLLAGYPMIEAQAIRELIPYIQEGREVVFMIDHLSQATLLNEIALVHDCTIEICLDINVSSPFPGLYFGTKRSPLGDEQQLNQLLTALQALRCIRIVGVMGYEAQIAGVGDRPIESWKRAIIPFLKARSKKGVQQWRQQAVRLVEQTFGPLRFVNGGGSGSLQWTAEQTEVTEVTVGSAFYYPALFSQFDTLPLEPATGFALSVVRKQSENIAVCHGGGYVASGSVSADKQPMPYLPEGLSLLVNEGAGEVQTPLHCNEPLQIGQTVYFRHAKAGELCERFNELLAVRGTKIEQIMRTYRGDGQCFL